MVKTWHGADNSDIVCSQSIPVLITLTFVCLFYYRLEMHCNLHSLFCGWCYCCTVR